MAVPSLPHGQGQDPVTVPDRCPDCEGTAEKPESLPLNPPPYEHTRWMCTHAFHSAPSPTAEPPGSAPSQKEPWVLWVHDDGRVSTIDDGHGEANGWRRVEVVERAELDRVKAELFAARREYDELWATERSRDSAVADLARERDEARASLEGKVDRGSTDDSPESRTPANSRGFSAELRRNLCGMGSAPPP